MARARWSQAPDDDAAAMYVEAMERLEAAGLEQYEISNVARPGRRSRHNLKYWTDGEWLGFGCGAHSTRDGVRWKNTLVHSGVRRAGRPWRLDRRRRAPPVARRAAGRRAVHRASASLTESMEMPYKPGTGLTSGAATARTSSRLSRSAACGGRISPQPDPPGNAPCSRGHDGFRVAARLHVNHRENADPGSGRPRPAVSGEQMHGMGRQVCQ